MRARIDDPRFPSRADVAFDHRLDRQHAADRERRSSPQILHVTKARGINSVSLHLDLPMPHVGSGAYDPMQEARLIYTLLRSHLPQETYDHVAALFEVTDAQDR